MEKIYSLDLKLQHQQIKAELFDLLEKVYDNAAFSGGNFVENFETNFAFFCNTTFALGMSNGTSALHAAMLALGVGSGDEVIIPANTYIATAWGVSHAGATPVFVDCTSDTWQIDTTKIEEKITPKTKAIIGVHLYGQPFNVDEVKKICNKHNLFLVEDAAQAHGARYRGQMVGAFGEMACFSFYPSKNLGACGEAGGITTNNESYAKHISVLRNQGVSTRYFHDEIGYNYRMGGLEAASLIVKLNYLDRWNSRRREIAVRYLTEINNPKITMQQQHELADGVFHLFVVTTENREEFCSYLTNNNIIPAFHYPVPCHLQKAYEHLGYKNGDLPNAEYLAAHCVSLPMYPELSDMQIEYIVRIINKY